MDQNGKRDCMCVLLKCGWGCGKVFSTKFGLVEHGRRYHLNLDGDIFYKKFQHDNHQHWLKTEKKGDDSLDQNESPVPQNTSAYTEEWNRWLQENSEANIMVDEESSCGDGEKILTNFTQNDQPKYCEIDHSPLELTLKSSAAATENEKQMPPLQRPPPQNKSPVIFHNNSNPTSIRTNIKVPAAAPVQSVELIDLTQIDDEPIIIMDQLPFTHMNNNHRHDGPQRKEGREEVVAKIAQYMKCLRRYEKLTFPEQDWRKSEEGSSILEKLLNANNNSLSSPVGREQDEKVETSFVGWKSFSCHFCSERFGRWEHLKTHEKNHKMTEAEEEYECEFCTKKYSHSANLRLHMMNNHRHAQGSQAAPKLVRNSRLTTTTIIDKVKMPPTTPLITKTPPCQTEVELQQQEPTDLSIKKCKVERPWPVTMNGGQSNKKRPFPLPHASELVLTCLTYAPPLKR